MCCIRRTSGKSRNLPTQYRRFWFGPAPHTQIRFGRALRSRRTKLGVSQEEFADICGLDRTYIGGIERGERNVSLVNLESSLMH